jgi:hypothetical protein
MNVVKGFRLTEISRWAQHHLQPDSMIISDGLPCFQLCMMRGVPI